MNSVRIQRGLREAYPRGNRLVSRERFVEIASKSVAESAQVDIQQVREAAYSMFDEKLDAIGSGMVNVRQAVSLLRHGFTTAAGNPVTLGKALFDKAAPSMRSAACVYDDAESLPSPRRWETYRWSHSLSRPRSQPNLEPIAKASPRANLVQRPFTQDGNSSAAVLPLAHFSGTPMERPESQGKQHAQKSGDEDDFGPVPMPLGSEDDESDYAGAEASEAFRPWGNTDASVRPPPSGGMRQSASLPALATPSAGSDYAPLNAEGVLRALSARVFLRMPRLAHALRDELDDGNGRANGEALVHCLREAASCGHPPIALPEKGLREFIAVFDHYKDNTVNLKELIRALTSGRMPRPGAKQHTLLPPSKVRRVRRLPKRADAAATASSAPTAPDPSGGRPSLAWTNLLDKSAVRKGSPEPSTSVSGGVPATTRKMITLEQIAMPMDSARKTVTHFSNWRKKKEAEKVDSAYDKTLLLQRRSARAAALLVASVKEKCTYEHNGTCTRKQFTDAMVELGVLGADENAPDELFASLDADGSGVIQVSELEAAVQQLMDPNASSHLEDLLKKGSSVSSSVMALREKLASMAARVVELFQVWDKDNDGQISRSEFIRAMPHLGLQDCLAVEINGLFTAFDPDGSGQISFRELNRMLRKEKVVKEKVVKPTGPPIPVLEVTQLRRDIKQELIIMNLRTEFHDMVMGDPKKAVDAWDEEDSGVTHRPKSKEPEEVSFWRPVSPPAQ